MADDYWLKEEEVGNNTKKKLEQIQKNYPKRRVLLLSLMYKPNFMKNARCMFESWSGTQWHPVLMAALGTYLEGKGHTVKLLDAQAYNMSDIEVGRVVSEFKPTHCCIWAGDMSIDHDIAFADFMNEKICPTKLIGAYLPLHREKYDIKGIDKGLEKGVENWITGLWSGDKHISGPHLTSEELDEMPFMSEFISRQLDERYYMTPSEPWPFTSFFIGRGCTWGWCTFCLWVHTYKRSYTRRSMLNVIREVAFIEKNLKKYKAIMIEDDTFCEDDLREFCELKLERGLKIKWSCYTMANLSLDVMRLMKKAGCLNMHVGFESGVPETLTKVKKGISVKKMEEFVRNSNKAGLKIHGDVMIGVDESYEDVQRTISWACKKLNCETIQFQPFIPFFAGENDNFSREQMNEWARQAYIRYYSQPRHWGAVIKQLAGKPKILREAIRSVIFGRMGGDDYRFGKREAISCD